MKYGRISLAGVILAAVFAGVSGTASLAEQNFIPSGHAWGPGFEQLPPLNSRQDRIDAQADVYETEIRRSQLELRIQMERLRLHHDLDLIRPGRGYFPY